MYCPVALIYTLSRKCWRNSDMSELCMRRTEGPLEITGGPTILRKKNNCDLKRSINYTEKILQIIETLRKNKSEQESQKKKKKI